jgi:hypothetical protein
MSRPTLEVADIIRASGSSFSERHSSHLAYQHRKVMDAIVRCRTAALGGHRDQCLRCGHQAISYNSCRNRHCPKCQDHARAKWLAARSAELLPVPYFHVVFTLPHELSGLALQNKRLLYDLLFRTSAATLLEVARDPKHLGADLGLLSVLHTWGQNLQHHPHVHCVVPAGGLALDGSRWIPASPRFFLPVRVLSRVFRGKFTAGLKQLLLQGKLQFHGSLEELATPKRFRHLLRQLFTKEWVVYAKPPFGGAEHVLHYLARYTHRVAISNHRLVAFKENRVSFRWKDYACSGKQKIMTLCTDEFLRRFLIHVLPQRPGSHPPLRSLCQPQTSRIAPALPLASRRHGVTATACTKQSTSVPAVLWRHAHHRADHWCTASLPFKRHVVQRNGKKPRQLLISS